eukprot:5551898-Amphidinium_carterae.2
MLGVGQLLGFTLKEMNEEMPQGTGAGQLGRFNRAARRLTTSLDSTTRPVASTCEGFTFCMLSNSRCSIAPDPWVDRRSTRPMGWLAPKWPGFPAHSGGPLRTSARDGQCR